MQTLRVDTVNGRGIAQKIIGKWRKEGTFMQHALPVLASFLVLSFAFSTLSPRSTYDTSSIASAYAQPASEISTTGIGKMTVTHEDMSFDIAVALSNGIIKNATIYPQFNYIVFDLETNIPETGELTVTLPRTLIDAKTEDLTADGQFTIVLDDYETDYVETNSTDVERTLTITIPPGVAEATIVGSSSVPEFNSAIATLTTAALITGVLVRQKYRPHLSTK